MHLAMDDRRLLLQNVVECSRPLSHRRRVPASTMCMRNPELLVIKLQQSHNLIKCTNKRKSSEFSSTSTSKAAATRRDGLWEITEKLFNLENNPATVNRHQVTEAQVRKMKDTAMSILILSVNNDIVGKIVVHTDLSQA